MTGGVRRIAGTLLATALLGWVLLRLGDLGDRSLAVPLTPPGELAGWVRDTRPEIMAMALVRLAALVTCSYLVAVLSLALLAALAGRRHGLVWILRWLPALLQRALAGGAGLGLAAGAALPSLAAPAAAQDRAGVPVEAVSGEEVSSGATAVMVKLPPPGATTTTTTAGPPATPPDAGDLPGGEPAAPTGERWRVAPGDSFWSIAEAVLPADGPAGRHSPDRVGRYWRRLITANRDRLADPDNPDLLLPGQELRLPDPG